MKMNLLKSSKILLVLVFLAVGSFLSGNEKEIFIQELNQESVVLENSSLVTVSGYSIGLYGVNQAYKSAYYYVKQKLGECSWTSYVLAVASIIRGKGNLNYPNNAGGYTNKIAHCKSWCNNSSYITRIEDYCEDVDNNAGYPIDCNRRVIDKNYDLTAVYAMLDHISDNHSPFLYIGSSNGIGHYYIVWSIYWGGSLSSSDVWYTNTLSSSNTFYSMNLQTFLNLNIMDYHNILFLY